MLRSEFRHLRFLLVSNYHTYGVQQGLYKYLVNQNVKEVFLLNHPLHGVATTLVSTLEHFPHNHTSTFIRKSLPEAINYVLDIFLTIKLAWAIPGVIDVYVGFNSLNAFTGVLLKASGKVRRVINYSHSFKETRYKNIFMNIFYKLIDSISVQNSDILWGLGEVLSSIRKAQGIDASKIVEIADGVDLDMVKPSPYIASKRNKLVFVGLINPINGLDLVIQALPQLIAWNKRLTLDIIGEGEDLPKIRKIVRSLGVASHIRFFSIEPMEKLGKHLARCGIGMATYQPLPDSTLKTTDPMKTKLYMAAGLPIVSTDIYASAHEIEDNKLGVLVPYDPQSILRAVKKIHIEKTYLLFRNNCLRAAKAYDWNLLFDQAFQLTFAHWRSI